LLCALFAVISVAPAQTVNIPLNYNFNGIVHARESGLPDAPFGYRSISDRGLDFTLGVPVDPLLSAYAITNVPGTNDIVHLGNRNTVAGASWVFDLTANGDCIGTIPTWLLNVDQTGPQTTSLGTPIPVLPGYNSSVSVLYQISNGGGSFDLTVGFVSGNMATALLTGNDWFGGNYPGTDGTDCANTGAPNLSITEGTVDLTPYIGEQISYISFSNRSNTQAGYAIIAANFNQRLSDTTVQIPLNYNFNGMVHVGEMNQPDNPTGYRSVSDRGLDWASPGVTGVPGVPANDPLLSKYLVVNTPGVLDIVHLGNRNTVTGGTWAFDPAPNSNNVGIQPNWLANVDQSTPQMTTLVNPVSLGTSSVASVIYQISDGGGSFDVTLGFASGTSYTQTLAAGDWYGGAYPGTHCQDAGCGPNFNLGITEGNLNLSAYAGESVTSITFSNSSNPNSAVVIIAANISGCLTCGNPGNVSNIGGGNGVSLTTSSTGRVGCAADLNVAGTTPNGLGVLVVSTPTASGIPASSLYAGCTGTVMVDIINPVLELNTISDAAGNFSLVYPASAIPQTLCGVTVFVQYGQFLPGLMPCPILLSDTLVITFGD